MAPDFPLSMFKNFVFFSNTRNDYLKNLTSTKHREHFAEICTEGEGSSVDVSQRHSVEKGQKNQYQTAQRKRLID